jgi:hypothetical protein
MKSPANLAEKSPRKPTVNATYNDNDIMVAKLKGPFHWHKHDGTDDFFLVLGADRADRPPSTGDEATAPPRILA